MTKLFNSQSSMRNLRYGKANSQKMSSSVRKLASGERITRAGDDAAGLSISTKIDSQVRSRYQAIRNANDSIGFMQVMEGSMQEMLNMVVRMRELSIASASDSYSDEERGMMDLEVTALLNEINRISSATELFGQKLTQGDERHLEFQIDIKNKKDHRLRLDLRDFAQSPFALGINDVKVNTQHRARMSLVKLDYAQKSISASVAKLGAFSNRVTSSIKNLENNQQNAKESNSRIKDADYAVQTAKAVSTNLKASMQAQAGNLINAGSKHVLKLLE